MAARLALAIVAIIIASTFVDADVYLHFPKGGNNRLDEANRDRNNGNRLWDSQNNNRGGSNHGTYGREYFYESSILRVEWTNQHSCGNPNNNCDIIIQYYCDANNTRDGLTTNTIPDVDTSQTQCLFENCDGDYRYGRHESYQSYQDCKWRQRNMGLWTSTQQLQGYGAIYTRQNENGNRHGYECPEERDYYPYWAPSMWKDIVILTNDTSRCPAWQAESQNVKSRWYCQVSQDYITSKVGTDPTQMNNHGMGFVPITQAQCESPTVNGKWTEVQPWNIPAPLCEQSPWTRDNHLGNTFGGETAAWNWTIPSHTLGVSCVFRLRYNITTRETRDAGEWASDTSIQSGALNASMNYIYIQPPNGIQIDNNDDTVETTNPLYFKYCDQLDVWSKYGLTRSDNAASFDPNLFYSGASFTRGYVFRNDPLVDIFGSLLPTQMFLRMALDTSQYGRTFQDRSHTFEIRARTDILKNSGTNIYNLGVRGKRGNIVQVYPGVEYDFVPNQLYVSQGDWIHFQWQGSNTNPGNNAGQGTAGTDRSNVIILNQYGRQYAPQSIANLRGPFNGTDGEVFESNWKLSYPSRIDSTVDFAGLAISDKRQLAIMGIYSPYFDYPPLQMKNAGIFNYLCTRNNAFTNRGQKAQITVFPVANADALLVTQSASTSQLISTSGSAWLRFAPDPNGLTTNTQLSITELGDGYIQVSPFLFDVIPGQYIMLDMTYTDRPLTEVYIYQSDSQDSNGSEQSSTNAQNGVASVKITRGGYYHVEQQVSASAVAGLVIGVVAAVGLGGFGYYKLKQKFHIRDKKYIAAAQNAATP